MPRYRSYKSDYKDSEIGFPSVQTPEAEKNDKYHRDWVKTMYSMWHQGKAAIPHSYQTDIDTLRLYAQGNQPIEQYLKQDASWSSSTPVNSIDNSDVQSKKWLRDGKNNLDLNIISVIPKVISMIKAYMSNIREDVVVDTIDPLSGAKKEDEKWKTYMYAQNKDFLDAYMQNAGIEPDSPSFMPENLEELEMYDQAGGFKLTHAMNMEKLVQYSLELSGYDDELENEIYDSLMTLNIAATKKKLDPEDLKYKDHLVDVKYLVVQHSRHNDFRDIDWAGHVEFYTIAQLRRFFPDLEEDEFRNMAYAYTSRLGNPDNFRKFNIVTDSGSRGYDSFKIAVFEGEWIDQKKEEAVFYDNKRGKTSILPVNDDTLQNSTQHQRYVQSSLQQLRQCSWVVGTDYVFDWGLANMQDRPAKNKVILNYNIRAISGTSLVYQMRPVADDLQSAYLRWQDARSNAVKDGYAVNMSMLQSIGTEKGKMDIWEVLELWKERGLLLYQYSFDGDYKGGKTMPIDRLPNTLLDEVQEFSASWDHALKRMEDVTGINALMLGAAPDPNAPVTTQKLSVASSANAIKPMGMAMSDIKRNSAKAFMRRFILACKARQDIIHSYEGVIGRMGIDQLLEASKSMADYGMAFTVRPTDAEKLDIYKAVEISMQNRREGRPGIDLQTAMYVKEQLQAGTNLKWLRFYIGAMEKRIFREDNQQKERMINLQADRNDRSAQIAAQSDMQRAQSEFQADSALESQKSQGELTRKLVEKDETVADQVARAMGLKAGQQQPVQ